MSPSEHACAGGEAMNNVCSHKLMAGQIRRDKVNKDLLLVHLSGPSGAREGRCHGRTHLLAIYTHL